MSAENVLDLKHNMSETLKKITNKMVFEGVTPKSGMRKVKAMKKLWRSDSLQMMKSILKEPPILEGRVRPPPINVDEDDDDIGTSEASPRESITEKNLKQKEGEYFRKRDDLINLYQQALDEDLTTLRGETEDIMGELLEKAKAHVENTEQGHLDEVVKEKILTTISSIKTYKNIKNKRLKLITEEDRKFVMLELDQYLEKETSVRAATYRQLLEKAYNFNLRNLENRFEDEYEDKARQIIRLNKNKFENAKSHLLMKQEKELKRLECKLEAEYTEVAKWSNNRAEMALAEAMQEIEMAREAADIGSQIESTCSLAARLQEKMVQKGWLPRFPDKAEDWEKLAGELMTKFQRFIEVALKSTKLNKGDYLISLEKLKSFKNRIAQETERQMLELKDEVEIRKKRLKAMTRAASLIDYLIREILPSPLPSRMSFSEIPKTEAIPECDEMKEDKPQQKKQSLMSVFSKDESMAVPLKKSIIVVQRKSVFTLDSSSGKTSFPAELNTTDTIRSYVDTASHNPNLYNLFFYNI